MTRSAHPTEGAASIPSAGVRQLVPSKDIAAIRELNEQCMELLSQALRTKPSPALEWLLPLKALLTSGRMDARHRVAQRSFLLVDFEFCDSSWWETIKSDPERISRRRVADEAFPKKQAIALARAVLMLAWHTARADFVGARILMGMTTPVANIVGTLRLSEIERIAEHQFRRLRLRWDDRPSVWRALLMAAHTGDAQALDALDVHALQLLLSEMVPHSK